MEKAEEKARERAREKAREKAREEEREKKREKVKMKREKGYDAWGGDGPRGVPTYPGAWTANLQLPCGSGQVWKAYFQLFLDDFFGDGTVLVSIFRKAAL